MIHTPMYAYRDTHTRTSAYSVFASWSYLNRCCSASAHDFDCNNGAGYIATDEQVNQIFVVDGCAVNLHYNVALHEFFAQRSRRPGQDIVDNIWFDHEADSCLGGLRGIEKVLSVHAQNVRVHQQQDVCALSLAISNEGLLRLEVTWTTWNIQSSITSLVHWHCGIRHVCKPTSGFSTFHFSDGYMVDCVIVDYIGNRPWLQSHESWLSPRLGASKLVVSRRLGASKLVKAESSGEDPRATWGLVSNLSHPGILAFLRIPMIFPVILKGSVENGTVGQLLYQEIFLLQGTCREMNASRFSTRGECRWPRADAVVHLHNRASAAVIRLLAPRVSLLLLPSCSFPDMRPATNSFSWYKTSIFDWFPRITGHIIGIPAKEGMCQCFHQCWDDDSFSYCSVNKRSNKAWFRFGMTQTTNIFSR